MKKIKLLIGAAMSFAAFAGQIHADTFAEWSDDSYCEYNKCCCENKWLVTEQFLWWSQGTEFPFANNIFENEGNGVASLSAPFASITDTTLAPYSRISEKWSPGVRLGLGWENCEGNWQIWGLWTGYSNYSRRVLHSAPPAPSATFFGPTNDGYLTTPIGAEVLTTTANIGSSVEDEVQGTVVTATHKLNYNVADLVFGTPLKSFCGVELMPYVGVRAAFINQRDYVFFTGVSEEVFDSGIFANFPASTKVEEELWCVGPRLGLEASWGEWCGFSLLGNISASILYGRLEECVRRYNTIIPAQLGKNGFSDPSIVTSNTYTRDRYNQIVPNLQVQLGVGYHFDIEFNCTPYSVDIFAMWEGNSYWAASNYLFREKALGLNGLTTGFAFSW